MPSNRLTNLAAVVIVVAALYFGRTVLVPLALAIFLSVVLSPLVARLERLRLGRAPSVIVVSLLAFAALGALGWVVGRQAIDTIDRLPEYREELDRKMALIHDRVDGPLHRATSEVEKIAKGISSSGGATTADGDGTAAVPATVAVSPASTWLSDSLGRLVSILTTAGIVVVLVILMLLQRGDLRDRFIALMGNGGLVVTSKALEEGSRRLGRYLLALTSINAAHGLAMGLGLLLIGVPNAMLWGILAAALRFVPYAGPWIAAIFPITFSLALRDGFTLPLEVAGLIVALELVSNQIVEPLVLPSRIGVSATALVVGAVFWTWLWGPAGLVLATPLTLCIAVLGRHFPQMRFLSLLLGDRSVLSPSLRLYQRLLVDDGEDAWNVVESELDAKESLIDVYDAVVIPALCLAQQDRHDRVIDGETLATIAQRARELVEQAADRRASRVKKGEEPVRRPDPLKVVCVPAGHESEDAACAMLAVALRDAGVEPVVVPTEALLSEAVDVIGDATGVVCVSQLPPVEFDRLRYVCKRIGERHPDLPIVIGTWTVEMEPARALARLGGDGRIQFASTFAEMQERVRRIESTLRANAPAPLPAAPMTVAPLSAAPAA